MEIIVAEKSGSAIQRAVDEAAKAGGGRISLEPGTYPCATIRHCLFSNIVCRSRNGIFFENPIRYLRKDCNGYLSASDIRFDHWDLECDDFPLRINVEGGIALRKLERLEFRDFRFRSREPVYLVGNAGSQLRDIVLSDFSGVVAKETPIVTSCVERLRLKDFEVTSGPGEPAKLERKPSPSWETQF